MWLGEKPGMQGVTDPMLAVAVNPLFCGTGVQERGRQPPPHEAGCTPPVPRASICVCITKTLGTSGDAPG